MSILSTQLRTKKKGKTDVTSISNAMSYRGEGDNIFVVAKDKKGLTCSIIAGGILGSRKGVNVPGVNLNMPFISKQDREDIIYACNHDGDFIALSFVSTKEDLLAAFHPDYRQDQFDVLKIGPNKGDKVPTELAEILGKDECISRLTKALQNSLYTSGIVKIGSANLPISVFSSIIGIYL